MKVVDSQKQNRRRSIKKRGKNKMGILGIASVVVILGIVLFYNVNQSQEEIRQLEKQEAKLQTELESQQQRRDDLEEQRVYVQTKKYIEEMAKKLGLVYPNEIIFKPNEE